MRVSEHLSQLHKTAAKHERSLAAHCTKTAGNLMTLYKESGMKEDDPSTEKTLADHFTKAAALHEHQADCHDQMLDDCVKATRDEDLRKLSPDGIRGVIPAPVTPILRYGQRELAKGAVDPEFEHLFADSTEADL